MTMTQVGEDGAWARVVAREVGGGLILGRY